MFAVLTQEEMVINSIIFMIAGYETTATTLSWLIYDMAIYPDIQETLVEAIDAELGQVLEPLTIIQMLNFGFKCLHTSSSTTTTTTTTTTATTTLL